MPMIRYQIRNEYGLADPELYRAPDRDDPEAILEGVAMAGLAGVLRQLGDLAEFAAEIFRELHEEVMATAARGHGLMLRVQQLEVEFPSIEKAFLSQISHSHFAYNTGIVWHANHHIDQNIITRGDMPRFILDSYEECRGPPRLFMLDKFDTAGAGTCLKRYSDPSFFKMELASSGTMEAEVQREKKVRKIKKKVSKNGEVVDSSLAHCINSNLQPEISKQVPEKAPTRRVKLKSRHSNSMDTSSIRSYMESILEVHSPEQKFLLENSISQPKVKIKSFEPAPEVHEILIDNSDKYPSFREKNRTQPPIKQITPVPINGLENQKRNDEEFLETRPPPFKDVQNMYPNFHSVVEKETVFDSENKTDGSGTSHRSSEAENNAPALQVYHNKLLADAECIREGFTDGNRSDDIGSEVDNFMDALNTMESEREIDFENKAKSDPGLSSMDSQGMLSDDNKGQQEWLAQFSEPNSVENSMEPSGLENIPSEGMPSVSNPDNFGNLDNTQPPLQKMISFDVNANSECLSETHDKTSEELWRNDEVIKLKSSVHLLTDETCNAEASVIPNFRSEIGEASSSSCATDLTYNLTHLCPQGSLDDAQSITSDTNEMSSYYAKSDHKVAEHLDSNVPSTTETTEASQLNGSPLRCRYSPEKTHPEEHVEDLISITSDTNEMSSYCAKSDHKVAEHLDNNVPSTTETSEASQLNGSPLGCRYSPDKTHPEEHVEDLISEDITGTLDMPNHISKKQDESTLEQSPTRYVEDSLLREPESREDTEACSSGSISPTTSALHPEIRSIVVKPDGLAAELENVIQPEDLAVEMSLESLRSTYEIAEHSDGTPIGGGDVLENALPIEDDEELNSSQTQNEIFLEVSAGHIEDSSVSLTVDIEGEQQELIERDAEACSGGIISPTSRPTSPATSYSSMQPTCLSAETENFVAPGEELAYSQSAVDLANTDDLSKSENLLPSILPIESKHLLDMEPQESLSVESVEFAPSNYEKETFHDGMQLLSNSEVISEPVPVGGYLRLPFRSTVANLHKDMLQIDQSIQCDDSSAKSVPAEAVLDYHELSSRYSPKLCGFAIQSQEDCVRGDADLKQHIVETTEASSPYNTTESHSEISHYVSLSPQDESLPVSSPAVSSSDSSKQDLSDSSDGKLFNGMCHTIPSEHVETALPLNIDEENLMYSLESEPHFSSRASTQCTHESTEEGIYSSTHFIIQPAIPVEEYPIAQACDEQNVISSYQEGEHPEPSDLQSEIAQSGEQDNIQSNSMEFDDKLSELRPEQDSQVTVIDENISELDIPPSNAGIHGQLEPEVSVPSECSFEHTVSSLAPINTAAGLPLFASVGLAISECNPHQFSESQISEPLLSFQSQEDIQETPPLPPLPPLEWRMGKLRPGSLTSERNLVQPLTVNNPSTGLSTKEESDQLENLFPPFPASKDDRSQRGELSLHNERMQPLRLSELPPIVEDKRYQHGIQGEVMHPSDPSLLASPTEVDKHLYSHDTLCGGMLQPSSQLAPVQSADDEVSVSQHLHQLQVEKLQHLEDDKGPQLGQLIPVELERFQLGELSIERDLVQSTGPFFRESSVEYEDYQYNYRVYGGENMQRLNWSSSTEIEKPNGKHRSIRNRPRHPLIDAVAAHDKSKLRKVSELVQHSARPMSDGRDTLLDQIRNKSFNLKPTAVTNPNIKGPPTNLKLAAILEKANTIRQACVGSDEDDDGDNWGDS